VYDYVTLYRPGQGTAAQYVAAVSHHCLRRQVLFYFSLLSFFFFLAYLAQQG
jgi:hypothetical protein